MGASTTRIFGPLISTGDVESQCALYRDVFGMEVVEEAMLDDHQVGTLFGGWPADGPVSAGLTVLRTPGVDNGIVLIAFDPAGQESIRTWETRVDRDALKVIDFYAPDFDAAIAHARSLGYDVVEADASYELDGDRFREAHLWGPDNVVSAFLGGPPRFFADFAQIHDRVVSEVQSISAPVSAGQEVVDFYRETLGWECVYEYAIDDPSFARMLGVDEMTLRSRNMGTSTREPYFGIIDYGLSADHDGSLFGRSRAPRRGLLGAVLITDALTALTRSAPDVTGEIIRLPLLGHTHAVRLDTPHSVPHLLLGTHQEVVTP